MTGVIAGQLALTNGNSLLLYQTPVPEKTCAVEVCSPEPPVENSSSTLPSDFGYEFLSYNSYGRINRPQLKGLVIDLRF